MFTNLKSGVIVTMLLFSAHLYAQQTDSKIDLQAAQKIVA